MTDAERLQSTLTPRLVARRAVLLMAVLCAGLMAGLFLLYAHTIMPGLGATDDRTFVGGFQEIDRSVENPFVRLTFFGGILLTAGTIVLDRRRPMLWWVATALVLLVATLVVTAAINVPLNAEIKAAGNPETIDVGRVRADFREGWWRGWNIVRCVTSMGAFACLVWSVVLYEQPDTSASPPTV